MCVCVCVIYLGRSWPSLKFVMINSSMGMEIVTIIIVDDGFVGIIHEEGFLGTEE